MSAWVWVPLEVVYVVHDRQISRHGGAPGVRDPGLVETACARPLNKAQYENVDVFDLSAAYTFGLAKAHAFVDGNKLTAFVVGVTFLRLNGHVFRPDPEKGLSMMERLATDVVPEPSYADWLREGATAI